VVDELSFSTEVGLDEIVVDPRLQVEIVFAGGLQQAVDAGLTDDVGLVDKADPVIRVEDLAALGTLLIFFEDFLAGHSLSPLLGRICRAGKQDNKSENLCQEKKHMVAKKNPANRICNVFNGILWAGK
jgi:hypothetical protein